MQIINDCLKVEEVDKIEGSIELPGDINNSKTKQFYLIHLDSVPYLLVSLCESTYAYLQSEWVYAGGGTFWIYFQKDINDYITSFTAHTLNTEKLLEELNR